MYFKMLPVYTFPDKNVYKSLESISYEQTYPNQNFVLSLMHPEAPYRGLLLTFQLGNGKTYVAAGLAHLYNSYGHPVLFLAHNLSTINNFRNEYDRFIVDNQVCDGYKDIKYMGITKFLSKHINIDHHLLIIDEAHNIRENASRYHKLQTILNKHDNIKILIITATPMIDRVDEIESLRNLIEPNAPIAYSDKTHNDVKVVFIGDHFGDIGIYYKSVMKGEQLSTYKKAIENSQRDIYTRARQASLSVEHPYHPSIPLDEQSCKVAKLLSSIVKGELTVVFSFFVTRGVYFIKDVLDHNGWREFGSGDEDDGRLCYALLHGKTPIDDVNHIIESFNSIMNVDGSVIQLLIGSSVMNESISLRNVNHVHILTPFWNYGQIRQAIGRTLRMRSHEDLEDPVLNIYLHVSVVEEEEGLYTGIDLDMYKVSHEKDKQIKEQIKYMTEQSIWHDHMDKSTITTSIPCVDHKLVLQSKNFIWDMRNVFDTNINKISWYNVYKDRVLCYDVKTGMRRMSNVDMYVTFPKPEEGVITAWRSVIDNRIRITDLRETTIKKRKKRGKLICNLKRNEITSIAEFLGVAPTITDILDKLKKIDRYIEEQIVINDL